MSEQKQAETNWEAEIKRFQESSIGKLKEYGLPRDFEKSVTDLSKSLTALTKGTSTLDSSENIPMTAEEEQKRALVRNMILEANETFFHALNQAADLPTETDEQKWQKMEAVFDACAQYQKDLNESGKLSHPNQYMLLMALTSGFKTLVSIAWAALLMYILTQSFSPSSLLMPLLPIAAGIFFIVSISLSLSADISALRCEQQRLEAKLNGKTFDMPENIGYGIDPSDVVAHLESIRELMCSNSNYMTPEDYTFGEHVEERLAGTDIASELRNAYAPTLFEHVQHMAKATYQHMPSFSFWSTETPTVVPENVDQNTQENNIVPHQ